MSKYLPWIYLSLSVLGAILPWKANLEFIAESTSPGFDLARFIADSSGTAASRSLSSDLLIGASAVTIWICSEGQRLKIPRWWIVLPISFGISFACAAPLFFFLRERHQQFQEKELKIDQTDVVRESDKAC